MKVVGLLAYTIAIPPSNFHPPLHTSSFLTMSIGFSLQNSQIHSSLSEVSSCSSPIRFLPSSELIGLVVLVLPLPCFSHICQSFYALSFMSSPSSCISSHYCSNMEFDYTMNLVLSTTPTLLLAPIPILKLTRCLYTSTLHARVVQSRKPTNFFVNGVNSTTTNIKNIVSWGLQCL